MSKFFDVLKNDLKLLQSGIEICGKLFHGYLYAFHADALALHQILGFKKSFSPFVIKNCHKCNEDSRSYHKKVYHEQCSLRTFKEHIEREEKIELLRTSNFEKYQALSSEWGINHKGMLSDIKHFNPIRDSLFDPMHVLFEGIVVKEIQLMLTSLMREKLIQREKLNNCLQSFKYHRSIKTSEYPKAFSSNDFNVKSTSKSLFVLALHLPIFLHLQGVQNNANVKCFKLILAITKIAWSQRVSVSTLNVCKKLIRNHQILFLELYTNKNFIPKMHMLLHVVDQLKTHGPGRHISCIRQEAKHNVIKQKKWYNYKNLTYSVSEMFCMELTYNFFHFNGQPKFDVSEHYKIVGESKICTNIFKEDHDLNNSLFTLSDVVINNKSYRAGDFILKQEEKITILFIEEIVLKSGKISFVCKKVSNNYNKRIMTYECNILCDIICITYSELEMPDTLLSYYIEKKLHVMIPSSRYPEII